MAQIDDFGEKIGGARKDMWKLHGITSRDFDEMNDIERSTYVKKDNVWIKPDWSKLIEEGTPQAIAYWQNKMRQAIPPKPEHTGEESQKNYISVVTQIRDAVMEVRDERGIKYFFNNFLLPTFTSSTSRSYRVNVNPEAVDVVTNKVLRAAQLSFRKLEQDAKKNLFGVPKDDKAYVAAKQDLKIYHYDGDLISLDKDPYNDGYTRMSIRTGLGYSYSYFSETSKWHNVDEWKKGTYFVQGKRGPIVRNIPTREEAVQFVEAYALSAQIESNSKSPSKEKPSGNRKQNFAPPQLAHVKYSGPKYRGIKHATSQMFLDELKFRGGEFGNWLNNDDRQASLDMGYDALRNMADILNIRPEDVSLNGNLAIAFGARGKGGPSAGAAHYEPLRQVINLTKMAGAGCLAHEWAHALDHAIGISSGLTGFASEEKARRSKGIPDSFSAVMSSLKYKEVVVPGDALKKEEEPKIAKAKTNLRNWINSVRPSKLPDDLSKGWEEVSNRIMENPSTFTGSEYFAFRRGDSVLTHPDVEQLSQICKFATNHVIPRDSKYQICAWVNSLNQALESAEKAQDTKKMVQTDFYKESGEFDKIFTKMGHGYWQSDCEMFARAFDCYITDKLREQGYRSDYLTSRADSFHFSLEDRVIAAYPKGEERAAINQAFDKLFEDLKERQFLHAPLVIEPDVQLGLPFSQTLEPEYVPEVPQKAVHYEQLSLDEILFAASSKASKGTSGKHGNLVDHVLSR